MSVVTNLAILGTIGRYHYLTHGAGSFLTVTGCGALGGSLATANAVSKNEHYVAASSNAIGAALVTFHAFKTPKLFTQFRYLKFLPLGWVALMGIYGIKYGDEGVLAGAAGGYAAGGYGGYAAPTVRSASYGGVPMATSYGGVPTATAVPAMQAAYAEPIAAPAMQAAPVAAQFGGSFVM